MLRKILLLTAAAIGLAFGDVLIRYKLEGVNRFAIMFGASSLVAFLALIGILARAKGEPLIPPTVTWVEVSIAIGLVGALYAIVDYLIFLLFGESTSVTLVTTALIMTSVWAAVIETLAGKKILNVNHWVGFALIIIGFLWTFYGDHVEAKRNEKGKQLEATK